MFAKNDKVITRSDNMLITVNELCNIMKVTRTSIDNWRKEGMPYQKFGKMVRFDKEEVMEWLKERNTKK